MGSPPFVTFAPALIACGRMKYDDDDPSRGHPDWDHLSDAPPEAKRKIADYHHQLLNGFDARGALEVPCLWFDLKSRRCRFHDHRPEVCRAFLVGCESCHAHRRYRGIEGPPIDTESGTVR